MKNLFPCFRSPTRWAAGRTRWLLIACLGVLALAPARAQNVVSLNCVPTVIGGGSGGSSSCTVQLNAPAPTGGAQVVLASSLTALAASVPTLVVPAGRRSATFAVTTNARYRAYSGLPFDVLVSATRQTTASATLQITAQARPADFTSGVGPGDPNQWQGAICGWVGPIAGNAEVLYSCTPATATAFGNCTFKQECASGCRRVPPNGDVFGDACSRAGKGPVTLASSVVQGGERVSAAVVTDRPVGAAPAFALTGTISNQGVAGAIDGISDNASIFPHDGGISIPRGSSNAAFTVATSIVPVTTFIDVVGVWSKQAQNNVIINSEGGHAWLTLTPPQPAPPLPIPTLGDFKVTGNNPVTGGQSSLGQIDVSGISSGGGPTIALTSSHPAIASLPATFVMPASTVLGQQVTITTQPPPADTVVTLTANDGVHTFQTLLTVLAVGPGPLLSGVSVSPTSVKGGNPATGTVTLSAQAPSGGVTIVLSTPLPNVALLPASVTVPAGAQSATFPIATVRVNETFSVNVFADLDGTSRQTLLTVTP